MSTDPPLSSTHYTPKDVRLDRSSTSDNPIGLAEMGKGELRISVKCTLMTVCDDQSRQLNVTRKNCRMLFLMIERVIPELE